MRWRGVQFVSTSRGQSHGYDKGRKVSPIVTPMVVSSVSIVKMHTLSSGAACSFAPACFALDGARLDAVLPSLPEPGRVGGDLPSLSQPTVSRIVSGNCVRAELDVGSCVGEGEHHAAE